MSQVYVACLASYNNGILHGEWIDATQDTNDIYEGIAKVLRTSPIPDAEEFAIHDYDDFGAINLGEYESIENVHAIAAALDEWPSAVVAHYHGEGVDAEDLDDHIRDRFIGTAEEELDEVSALASYILSEEDWYWDELPKQFETHMGAIAQSEARDRLLSGSTVALYAGRGTWHFLSND
ncbi:antirestriction protein ArdA [Streptomyces violascens]|uniref:antirestriction protein ArdA n=1 Tax=Streptomyces violascens TaxID=67381 RepID=UPI00365CE3E8